MAVIARNLEPASRAVLWPPVGPLADRFVAILKRSFRMDAAFREVEARPLVGDPREHGERALAMVPNDFWWRKVSVDVIVSGTVSVGRPVQRHDVAVSVGPITKRVMVQGDRVARVRRGGVVFEGPQPFDSMPMQHRRTYGGIDPRSAETPAYPRNRFGCGYVAVDGDCEVTLPNFEDPASPIEPASLLPRPGLPWWKRPLPWSTLPMLPAAFPRSAYVREGAPPALPLNRAMLPEVSRHLLPAPIDSSLPSTVGRGFFCEASLGLALRVLPPKTPIILDGFAGRYAFGMPSAPPCVVAWEHHRWPVVLRPITVLCDLSAEVVDIVWSGVVQLEHAVPNPRLSEVPARLGVEGGMR